MRILVYPHDMNMGGSQLNAIELAASVKALGHEVVIAGQHGSLRGTVDALGLEFIELPAPGRRPSLRVIYALRREIAQRGIQLVHGYEWPPSLEAELACLRGPAIAASTVLSMAVAPFIPTGMPLMVGTEQIAEAERRFGRRAVSLMEPPIDTALNRPGLGLPVDEPAARWGIHGQGLTLAIVSRLAHEMKLEGILAAIDVVASWDAGMPLQLVIAGDGPAAETVASAAAAANDRCGQQRVVLTGQLDDPRWLYARADIVLGMGGSILRAMAFGKPVIIQGERGFWRLLDEDSLPEFLWQGWYGSGQGARFGASALEGELRRLAADGSLRRQLGEFSLSVVVQRFSLDAAARRQVQFYEGVLASDANRRQRASERAAATVRFAGYKLGRLAARLRGTATADDFNAKAALRTEPDLSEVRS